MKTFQRYVFRESLFPVLSSICLVAGILIVARLVKITTLVINRGLAISELGHLLALFAPSFLELAVPMGLMLGVLIALNRLAVDGELIGAQACGLDYRYLLRPTLGLAAVAMFLTATLSLGIRPQSRAALVALIEDIGRRHASAALQEQVFFDQIPGLVLYADRIEQRGKILVGVFVADTRAADKRTSIVARRGYLLSTAAKQDGTVLRLEDGLVFTWQGATDNFEVTQFEELDWDLSDSLRNSSGSRAGLERDLRAISTGEILQSLREDTNVAAVSTLVLELNRRFATPVACLVFTMVAVAWSFRRRSPLPSSIALSTTCFVSYYFLESIADAVVQRFGGIPVAAAAAWLPPIAFGCLALVTWPPAPHQRRFSRRDDRLSPEVAATNSAKRAHPGHL